MGRSRSIVSSDRSSLVRRIQDADEMDKKICVFQDLCIFLTHRQEKYRKEHRETCALFDIFLSVTHLSCALSLSLSLSVPHSCLSPHLSLPPLPLYALSPPNATTRSSPFESSWTTPYHLLLSARSRHLTV